MAAFRRRLRCERLAAFGLLVFVACGSTGGSPPGTAGTFGGAGAAGMGAAGSGTGGAGASGGGGLGGADAGGRAGGGGAGGAAGAGGEGAGGVAIAGAGGAGGAAGASAGGAGGAAGASVAGRGGAAGSGGTAGAAGGTGGGGAAGRAGTTGSGGAGGCTFSVTSSLATAIPTVGIVTFSTTLLNVSGARIEFGLAAGGPKLTAPVDLSLSQAGYRTLLLGMKPSSTYAFKVIAQSSAGTSCESSSSTLTTGAAPSALMPPKLTVMNAAARDRGFIITSNTGSPYYVFILDPDGAVVWWTVFQGIPTRAHMSWDGRDMYIVNESAGGATQTTAGNVARISMDGTNSETHLSGLGGAHHDVTAIPNGVAAIMWNTSDQDAHNSVVERAADGTITTVVADLADVYNSTTFHPNSIHYAPWDDSYTIGDRNPNLFVKITRKGQLVWQLGGTNPKDPSKFFLLQGVPTWFVNHGHHLLADGTFVFFNNAGRAVRVLKLDEATMTATSVLTYSGVSGQILGDAQRLPNGNILATDSDAKHIDELDASGHVVATFVASQYLGYAEFRESLYGPPPY